MSVKPVTDIHTSDHITEHLSQTSTFKPEVAAVVAEQAQQVPGQPLTDIQVEAAGVVLDLAEQHLLQSLQGLVLHRALRVHHGRHHALQPRLLHHAALRFGLRGKDKRTQSE